MEAIIKKVLDTSRIYKGEPIVAVTNDKNSRFIQAVICTDGVPNYVVSSDAVIVTYERADGTSKTYNGTSNADGSVKVPIASWATEEEGDVYGWITVGTGAAALSTTRFLIEVQYKPNTDGTVTPDDPEYNDIMAILSRITTNENNIATNALSIQKASALASSNSKRLSNLESRLGDSASITDDSIAYAKTVPDGVLPYAEITKIGGMTYRDEATNTLKSAKVTAIKSIGKNLIPFPYYSQSNTSQGIAFTVNANGSITVKGTCIADTSFALFIGKIHLISSVRLTGVLKGGSNTYYLQPYFNDKAATAIYNGSYTYAEDLSKTGLTRLMLFVKAGSVIDETLYPMLSYASLGNIEYEPYKESILPIPASVQSLEGFGMGANDAYNYIDLDKKQFINAVRVITFNGSESWLYVEAHGLFVLDIGAVTENIGVCSHYRKNKKIFWDNLEDKEFNILSVSLLVIKDASFGGDLDSWKRYVADQYDKGTPITVVVARKNNIVTDISNLITYDNLIEVSEGGLVIAENADGLDAPTTITYQIKEDAE